MTSPHLQIPWYGWMCEQADTFCKYTWTGFEHFLHLKVSVRDDLLLIFSLLDWEADTGFIIAGVAAAGPLCPEDAKAAV
jgi:hypothetical protein